MAQRLIPLLTPVSGSTYLSITRVEAIGLKKRRHEIGWALASLSISLLPLLSLSLSPLSLSLSVFLSHSLGLSPSLSPLLSLSLSLSPLSLSVFLSLPLSLTPVPVLQAQP